MLGKLKVYFPKHVFCLLSIRSYEACMIMYARALYHSFKVKWKSLLSHTFFVLLSLRA